MPEDLENVWKRLRLELRQEVSELTFHAWLAPLEAAALEDGRLFLRAPGHLRGWVEERLRPALNAAATRTVGRPVEVELVDGAWVAPEPASEEPPARERTLNPKYTFEQFVIGRGNRMAHAAALKVAELPGQAYNPLFLYGRPGLGKTHLLQAIGHYVDRHGGGLSVRYATVESFTSGFLRALREGATAAFKESFRTADVLLVDDVQFLAGKERTMEEFFHTFDALYESGRQLVLSSDRPPWEIPDVEARLMERFGCGLVADLEPPDLPVRMAILRARARHDEITRVGEDTLEEIAQHVSASVRALEGALVRVIAYASLRNGEATPEVARHVLERLYPHQRAAPPSVEEVIAATAEQFDLDADVLAAHDRRRPHVWARQVAMYLARELTGESLPVIGRHLGGREHSTVLSAHRRVKRALEAGEAGSEAVLGLRTRLDRSPSRP